MKEKSVDPDGAGLVEQVFDSEIRQAYDAGKSYHAIRERSGATGSLGIPRDGQLADSN